MAEREQIPGYYAGAFGRHLVEVRRWQKHEWPFRNEWSADLNVVSRSAGTIFASRCRSRELSIQRRSRDVARADGPRWRSAIRWASSIRGTVSEADGTGAAREQRTQRRAGGWNRKIENRPVAVA